ncbi:MAG: ferredoxin [bacterium]|nr:ferredoxin [bacterium]
MADKNSKQPENAPGKWYVDTTCVPCHSCVDEAPNLLKYSDAEDYVYFDRQPENPEEEKAAQFALQACPTEAIGDDGD